MYPNKANRLQVFLTINSFDSTTSAITSLSYLSILLQENLRIQNLGSQFFAKSVIEADPNDLKFSFLHQR